VPELAFSPPLARNRVPYGWAEQAAHKNDSQWSDAGFAKVGAAFDALFKARGTAR